MWTQSNLSGLLASPVSTQNQNCLQVTASQEGVIQIEIQELLGYLFIDCVIHEHLYLLADENS